MGVVLAAVTLGLVPTGATAERLSPPLKRLAGTAAQVLNAYRHPATVTAARYYRAGQWYATGGPSCWYCYDSAAVAAATLSSQPGGPGWLRPVAVQTLSSAIKRYQLPSGAFGDPYPTPDPIGTGFFSVDLGVSYFELRDVLRAGTRRAWSNAIRRAADYLISSGNMTWYTNGNVNLRQTEVMWLAWKITGQRRFLSAYNAEWSFTISPNQQHWTDFGLKITRHPTVPDGSNGAGYLAESGDGGTPGFDPSYADAQLDTATDLYVLTHSSRYLRLMNLLFNQLRPLINKDWILDAEHGSRKSYLTPFMNPAVSVLASTDRPGLRPLVSNQLAVVESQYKGAENFTNPNFYKGFEAWISMPLLNRQWPGGIAA